MSHLTKGSIRPRTLGNPAAGVYLLVAALGCVMLTAAPAHAQLQDRRNMDADRLRPAMSREGIINVESGAVAGHLEWDAALWMDFIDDPMVLNSGDRRFVSLLKHRLGMNLIGSLSLFDLLQVGVDVPLVLYQRRPDKAIDVVGLEPIASGGLGDLAITPKVSLLQADEEFVDLALLVRLTLPTASPKRDYLGEKTLTATPEVAVSKSFAGFTVGMNLGFLFRDNLDSSSLSLDISHELILRLGGSYDFRELFDIGLSLDASVEMFTQTTDPFAQGNAGGGEWALGAAYEITDYLEVFFGGGTALSSGYSIPDYRIFAGVRIFGRAAAPLPALKPDPKPVIVPAPGDADGDTIMDDADECPEQPEDRDEFQDDDGCPDPDNDGDGIPDVNDGAPLEAEDIDQFQDDDGIPDPDNDADGLDDANEKCPNEVEDYDGFEDTDGCPDLDNDQDGVLDENDIAPLEAEDPDGFEDDDGAPDPDNDGDGFLDADDKCPNEAELINGVDDDDGCPDVGESKVKITAEKIEILDKVFFNSSKATIQARSFGLLNQVAAVLKANRQVTKVRVEGHTDSRGSEELNRDLSQQRADAVKRYLTEHGVGGERLESVGYGEARPIASNSTSRGRESNRRVEFVIVEINGKPATSTGTIKSEAEAP